MTNKNDMKLWKYSGTLLTATGIIHTLYALFIGKAAFAAMWQAGLVNAAGKACDRHFALWFLICGIVLIFWGQTLQYYITREQKPAPAALGYSLLLFTAAGCIVIPVSGIWLFLPQALIIIVANKKNAL